MKVDVLGLGAVAMDIVLQCEDLPREDGFAFVHEEKLMPGGSCANVLVTLANLGARCGVLAKVGEDQYGNILSKDLKEAGISTQYLLTKECGTTLHTFIAVARNGSKAILVNLGDSFLSLSEDEVTPEMLEGVKVFYTDMFVGRPALKLARLCREKGITVFFNLQCTPSFMELCRVSGRELEEMISICDLFCLGREALRELSAAGDGLGAGLAVYKKYHPEMGVVATLGDKGAAWINHQETLLVPAFRVKASDTTGAGDAFAGGLIYALFIRRHDRKRSIEFASACAAIKCMQPGPRFKANEMDVRRFLDQHQNLSNSENRGACNEQDDQDTAGGKKGNESRKICRIGILLGNRSNSFWTGMKRQYELFASEIAVEVEHFWAFPEGDGDAQLKEFIKMQNLGYDVLIINPIFKRNLVSGIIRAASRGIPLLDVGAKTDQGSVKDAKPFYTPVRTVNFHQQGEIGATYIAQRLRALGGGKVIIIEGRGESAQSIGRSQGAADVFAKEPLIQCLGREPADFDREKARMIALNVMNREAGIMAFFCVNDLMALGVADATRVLDKKSQTIIVGVDLIDEARDAIRSGLMDASVAFSPAAVARVVLRDALRVLKGEKIPEEFSVPSVLINRENLDSCKDW
jgi:sugar/nucleoside kinase (ribokinase family)/ABC-type sugar transport system substrate-binding protein